MNKEKQNEVNCRNGFRYIWRETAGFQICLIVFICRRRRSEGLLNFLGGSNLNTLINFLHLQRVVRTSFLLGGSYVKHADNLPSSAEGGKGNVLPGRKLRQTC